MSDAKAKSKREKVAAKIRALMAKTVENGCSEGEAMSAAAKVAEMLAEHDLTVDEVNLAEDGFTRAERPVEDVVDMHLWKVCLAISTLCGVRSWTVGVGKTASKLVFFGLSTDVEVAGYILSIAERAMRDAVARVETDQALMRPTVRRRRVLSFVDGMATRLAEKIREIAWARTRDRGVGLVPVKDALVEAEIRERGIALRRDEDRFGQAGMPNYDDGRAAAEGIRFDASITDVPREPLAALRNE